MTTTSSAPPTTWALLRIRPSARTMKPEPSPRTGMRICDDSPPKRCCKPRRKSRIASDSAAPAASSVSSPGIEPDIAPDVDTLRVPLTLMLTTAGPQRAAMLAMSGRPATCGMGVSMDEADGAATSANCAWLCGY